MKTLPLSKVFHFIEPGPVVLVSTLHKGRANLMTMSWHTMMEFTPPLIGCVLGSGDRSFGALRATRECVIAIPAADLADTAVGIGNCSGDEVDKFAAFGLTALPASKVKAPLVAECFVNLECRVADTWMKYNLFILEVVKAWTDPLRKERRTIHHNGDGTFAVDGATLDLKKKMVKWKEFC